MKSRATRRFCGCYAKLPRHIQRLAVKNYKLWLADPRHPSLDFKKLWGSAERFAVRVEDHYRAIAERANDGVVWVWIGTHEEYNRLVSR